MRNQCLMSKMRLQYNTTILKTIRGLLTHLILFDVLNTLL